MIPDSVNCKNRNIDYCSYAVSRDCPETCAYYKYIFGSSKREVEDTTELGIGAMVDTTILNQMNKGGREK